MTLGLVGAFLSSGIGKQTISRLSVILVSSEERNRAIMLACIFVLASVLGKQK